MELDERMAADPARDDMLILVDGLDRVAAKNLDKVITDQIEEAFTEHGVELAMGQFVKAFELIDGGVRMVTTKDTFEVDYAILGAGFLPRTELVQGQVETVRPGAILVDEYMRATLTGESEPSQDVFAAGDAATVLYTPTGNEYDQFVALHGEPKVIKTNLSLDMRGLMGNCGTHITFSGKKGAMQYNANSTSLEMASDAQQRVLTLMSYDEPTGKLVLQVRRGNTVTGNLDGTLHDGTFEGKFRNVNGSASSFSFK